MNARRLLLVSAALFSAVGCAQGSATGGAIPAPLPKAVSCADASDLREFAADARGRVADLDGDRARIVGGNRARFLASLATIAELRCRTVGADVDVLLDEALEIARVAETTSSEYEAARKWTEADLVAADAIALLIGQIPAPTFR